VELDQLQSHLKLHFNDRALLQQALTHRSFLNEHTDADVEHNERLEFLGDAVLDFLAGELLYKRFPELPEGELTRLRASIVRTEALAELARVCELGEALVMGKGEEKGGGRERLNNLCAAFEALVGALYLDQGVDAVRDFVTPYLMTLLQRVLDDNLHIDARSQLQEWSQAQRNVTPQYRTVSESGPDHQKEFMLEVLIGDEVMGSGTGRSKQAAAQSAARDALLKIKANGVSDNSSIVTSS
jgi:ribonuclease III